MSDRAEPYVVPPGGTLRDDAILPFKTTAAETGGSLSVCEFTLGGWESGPVQHVHSATDEAFYVIAGVLEAHLDDERVQVPAGAFVWVPRGTAHAFANAGPDGLHVLSIIVPGGIEDLFAEQAAYLASLSGAPDADVLAEIGERHGAPDPRSSDPGSTSSG